MAWCARSARREELYARPAHADVAEFMGYRNLIRSACRAATGSISIGGGALQGTADRRR